MTIRFILMNAYSIGGTIPTTFTTAARYDSGALARRVEHILGEAEPAKGARRRSSAGPALSLVTPEVARRARRRARGR